MNLAAWVYLPLAAMTIARADATMTRLPLQTQDQSGYVLFLPVMGGAVIGVAAIGFLVGGR